MTLRGNASLIRSVQILGIAGVAAASIWVFQNRATLAAACLSTIDGVTSRVAHMNEPFGLGTTVESKNPVVGIVPDFALTERSGRSVQRSDLLGSYWVASFVFTRCATSCPLIVAEFTALQKELPEEVLLVSFSVDPEHDTPEVLAVFADNAGADPERWLFLTGDKLSIYRDVREGFHLTVQRNDDARPGWEVTHTPRFALVDPKGRIRGYYDSSDPEDHVRLCADIERLLSRGRTSEVNEVDADVALETEPQGDGG